MYRRRQMVYVPSLLKITTITSGIVKIEPNRNEGFYTLTSPGKIQFHTLSHKNKVSRVYFFLNDDGNSYLLPVMLWLGSQNQGYVQDCTSFKENLTFDDVPKSEKLFWNIVSTSNGMNITAGGLSVLKLNYHDRRNNGNPNCKGLSNGGNTVQFVTHDNATFNVLIKGLMTLL